MSRSLVSDTEIREYLLTHPLMKVVGAARALGVHDRRITAIRKAIELETNPASSRPSKPARGRPRKQVRALGSNDPVITGVTAKSDLVDIDEIKRRAMIDFESRDNLENLKKNQSVRFSHGPVCIIFAGDTHLGARGTDLKRVYDEHALMTRVPNGHVVHTGDLIDNFIVGKLKNVHFKARASISDQWALGEDLLKSLGPRLLAVVGGNHDAWTDMLSSVDNLSNITPHHALYDPDEIRLTLHVAHQEYRIRVRHKWRGFSMYNPTHGQERAARFDTSGFDIFVGAHLHIGGMTREFIGSDGRRKLSISTGAYKTFDSYAKTEGFPGSDGSTAVAVIFFETGGWMTTSNLEHANQVMRALTR